LLEMEMREVRRGAGNGEMAIFLPLYIYYVF
jgi:hypothetical protein